MRMPGVFAPWGRWETTEDGGVMLSFRCACSPKEVTTQFVTPENGHGAEVRCPRCRNLFIQVRVSRQMEADGGAPGSGKKGG